MDFDETEGMISKIDTSKPLRKSTIDLYSAVVELQTKVNEIIDALNVYMLPDDEDADSDDDDDEEPTVVSPSQVNLGSTKKRNS